MIFFDQYKLESLDKENFKKEYNKSEEYFWDCKKNICNKHNFFIVKALTFSVDENNGSRYLSETIQKNYIREINYIAVLPTDVYSVLDFYWNSLYMSNDIVYILSNVEIEKYMELKKNKTINYLDKKLFFRKEKFILMVNDQSREKNFLIVSYKDDISFDNFMKYQKIMGNYVKMIIDEKDIKLSEKMYKEYISGNIDPETRISIETFLNSENIKKIEVDNIISFLKSEVEKALLDIDNFGEKTEWSEDEKERRFLIAYKNLLINYKNFYEDYEEKRKELELLETHVDVEVMLDDITLYRHSEDYWSNLMDQSYFLFLQDKNLIDEEYFRVLQSIEEIENKL